MDKIFECAQNFKKLVNTKYCFHISAHRKVSIITLDFLIKDFRHAVGLHYLNDIEIEENPEKVMDSILDGEITDAMLEKSDKYKISSQYCGSIQERIDDMRYLEACMDQSDFLRIYQIQPFGSRINADYYIEATNSAQKTKAYIFIRKREESDNYVIVSFFRRHMVFRGITTYWMLKEKIHDGIVQELYRNPSYKK